MRVLLATDSSPHAEDALRIVNAMAMPPRSVVRVVRVVEPFPGISAFAPAAISAMTAAAEQQVRDELERTAAKLRARGRDVERLLVLGRAADVIVERCARSSSRKTVWSRLPPARGC